MATSAKQLHTKLHGPAIAELIEIVLDGVEDRNLRGVLAALVANGEMEKACLLKDLHMLQREAKAQAKAKGKR